MQSWLSDLPQNLQDKVTAVEQQIAPKLAIIDDQVVYNQQRVLELFRNIMLVKKI